MKFLLMLFVLFMSSSSRASWTDNAKFENFASYFANLMQESIYELERRHWCNLKIDDLQVTTNEQIYDENYQGTAEYTNGFVVSIQNIDVSNIMQNFVVGSTTRVTTGSMTALLVFHDVQLGFDVHANLGERGEHRFTGVILHNVISFDIRIEKNYDTGTITTAVTLRQLSSDISTIMQYSPPSAIGEVLSRSYRADLPWDSVRAWGTNIIAPIIQEQISKLSFPEVCFNC